MVSPLADPNVQHLMRRDDAVEAVAMQVAMHHERERGWEPTDVSHDYDGSGFDIRSMGPVDAADVRQVRRIEVKGRSGDLQDIMLTPNEWLQAHRHGPSYWLYVVWDCATASPCLLTIQDPAQVLGGAVHELLEVKGYRVAAEALVGGQS
jgi:hypothetical protein